MISDKELEKLLQSPETQTIDFKGSIYDLKAPRGYNGKGYLDLLKDILCMSNTPRKESSYIILGVLNKPGLQNRVLGIKSQVDDNEIQNILKRWLDPCPDVLYFEAMYKGLRVGILEVSNNRKLGPYYLKQQPKLSQNQLDIIQQNSSFLRQNVLYFRQGTTNTEATPKQKEYIEEWFSSYSDERWQNWDLFKQFVYPFDVDRHYILIASPFRHVNEKILSAFSKIDWTAVVDFDYKSDIDGLLSQINLSVFRRNIIQVTRGQYPNFNVEQSAYWFFAQGLDGVENTIVNGHGHRNWLRLYMSEIANQLNHIQTHISPNLVTFIVAWYDETLLEHLRTTIDSTAQFYSADFVVVSNNLKILNSLSEEYIPYDRRLDISLGDLCSGLENEFSEELIDVEKFTIPSNTGAPIEVNLDKRKWLEESFEIIYSNIKFDNDGIDLESDFLRGGQISWHELNLNKDAQRDISDKISRRIRDDLSKRETVRIQLYHKPGAGGTTIARRILWDFHLSYPCILLKYNTSDPLKIAERLAYIYAISAQPILLLVDSSNVPDRLVEDLFNALRSRNTNVVLLLVSRRFNNPPDSKSARSFFVDLSLSNAESQRFFDKYSTAVPQRKEKLRKLLLANDILDRNAFSFGITAYDENFLGIDNFILSRIANLTKDQKSILIFLSLAYRYAQRGIPEQSFAVLLGFPPDRKINLNKIFHDAIGVLDIIIRQDRAWRIIHALIADRILEIELSGNNVDRRIWKQELSIWAKKFIAFSRGDKYNIVSSEMIELIRRTFVYRDNLDLLGTEIAVTNQFAQIIQDIPSNEGKLELFRHLVEIYPEEPHFWAHLGRFQGRIMMNYDDALEAIQNALKLQPEDRVLWHMRGMIYRYKVQDLINSKSELDDIIKLVQLASDCFEQSRILNPDEEHGYISEVQMIIQVVNYVASKHDGNIMNYLKKYSSLPYLRDALDRAEVLMSQIRINREGENPSPYHDNARSQLSHLYGDTKESLQILDGLLHRKDVYHPTIRRQIIYVLLSRDKAWNKMRSESQQRCVSLLQANLDENPNNETDLRLWLQAIRYLDSPPTIEAIIEKVSYWKTNTGSLESTYYLYILYALRALEGLPLEREHAIKYMDECRQMARNRRNRLKSLEWYGIGKGINALIHQSAVGEWQSENNFWANSDALVRLTGRISRYDGPESGQIEINGMSAFFVPASRKKEPITSDAINKKAEFYLGFSYSGLRAWDVELI